MGDLVQVCGADPIPVQTGPGEPPVRSSPTERAFAVTLAEVLGVGDVPVDAHVFDDLGADSMTMAKFCARVRKRGDLPAVSIKDVYQHPSVAALAAAVAPAPAAGPAPVETALAGVLAEVLGVGDVPVDAHVFDDLGADSMTMAKFCARVRRRGDLPAVSIKDVYASPTVRGLALSLAAAPRTTSAPATVDGAPATVDGPAVSEVTSPTSAEPSHRPSHRASRQQYALCGAVQLLLFIAYAYLGAVILDRGYLWISGASDWFGMYLRSVVFGGVSLLGLSILPIVAKWALVGRWKPGQIRIWTPAYLRFWLVKTLIRANPLLLFAGERGQTSGSSPLVTLYLRALGAKVGRGVAIYSRNLPVCTDLLTIGDGSVIRKDTFFNGYRAHDGVIQTGAVTLGRDVFIGEATVLDIGTAMGDGSQLGHSSALQTGQVVPAGERWHGSPAQPGDVDYRGVGPASCGPNRRAFYVAGQLFNMLFIYVPLATIGAGLLLAGVPQLNRYLATDVSLTGPTLYRDAAIASAVLFCGAIIVGLLFVRTFPRLLNRFIEPGRTYPLYGFHYGIHRTIGRLTNVKFFTALFGDSSYIVHYLRWIGYDLSTEEQTGSNFGTVVKHETPYHVSVGKGTMSADALSIVNADFSSTSFRVAPVSIGAHNFFGNGITYPSQGRTGENCLIGTKTLVPIGGEVRENIGLLGSPSFEIPRTVLRDSRLAPTSEEDFRRRLRVKNHYNLRSMGLFLLMRWGEFFGITVLAMIAADIYQRTGSELAVHVEILAVTLFIFAYGVLAECGIRRFRPLQPQTCSIYDPYFRWHERFWKFALPGIDKMLVGTPFKNILNRLLGVKVGRMVFDDGAGMPERTLVEIGDHCTLNEDSHLQAHSQEDGAFKSDRIRVGAGCTLGVGAFAHYGVTLEDGAVLAAGSFLMKGEEVPAGEHWAGHPAVAVERLPQPLPSGGLQPPPGSSSRPTDRAALSVKPAQHTGARHRSSRPQDRVAPGSVPLPRSDGRHRAGRRPAEAQQR